MQKEQIPLLKELVEKVAGKNAEIIVDIIAGGKPVNEFKIAEKLKLTINQTRNVLYKLSAQNIVSFVRKKDTKKGWYIYSWSINFQKSLERLLEWKKKEIHNFESLLDSRQSKRFYVCPSECLEISEENAMLHDFKCSECGSLLQFKSYTAEIAELKEKIKKSEGEMDIIKVELARINAERERRDQREMAKKKIERQKKRALARKKAMRLKKKLEKPKKKEKKAKKKKAKKKERKMKRAGKKPKKRR